MLYDIDVRKYISIVGNYQLFIFVHSRKEVAKTTQIIALANDTLSKIEGG